MKPQRTDRAPPNRLRPRAGPVLAGCRVTVIGLGGVGHQVARQLAAIGLPWLQLIDHRLVGRRTHLAEGYAADDVGRPRVHATAQQCHQLNPKLEIHTERRRSLRGLHLGDAVFCAPGGAVILRSAGPTFGGPVAFVATCKRNRIQGLC